MGRRHQRILQTLKNETEHSIESDNNTTNHGSKQLKDLGRSTLENDYTVNAEER